MPIPVGRSGNVDGEGGDENGTMRYFTLPNCGWVLCVGPDPLLREWLESPGVQLGGVRGTGATFPISVACSVHGVLTAAMEPEPSMAELPDDADDNGTDDA